MSAPYWKPRNVADFLGVHTSTVGRLVDREGLPAIVLTRGKATEKRAGRRSLRFEPAAVEAWIASRRERQLVATIEGRRYTRGGAA
ncbi:MAG: helix-turn-helix transcriptional regulator [Candidatus Polarisedimenticolia bacterium]